MSEETITLTRSELAALIEAAVSEALGEFASYRKSAREASREWAARARRDPGKYAEMLRRNREFYRGLSPEQKRARAEKDKARRARMSEAQRERERSLQRERGRRYRARKKAEQASTPPA